MKEEEEVTCFFICYFCFYCVCVIDSNQDRIIGWKIQKKKTKFFHFLVVKLLFGNQSIKLKTRSLYR